MPFLNLPLRVLIVDDNPDDRALVAREVLRDHPSAEIVEAGTPAELEAAIAEDRISLGVFDYSIGWTNGVEVLARIRSIDPDTPVILFTGSLGEEEAAEAIKIGFNDFILKAVDRLPRLRASINAFLEQKEERQGRRRAEARYRALFENVTVGLFATRNDGTIEEGNEALVRQLCATSIDELRGRHILDFVKSDQAREEWRKMASGESPNGITALEVELNDCDGERWALLDAHSADAARVQIEGVLTDVTPLRKALDDRAALLGEVHHRVHNNLQIVQALLAFQANRFADPVVRQAFNEVSTRIQALSMVQQQLYQSGEYSAVNFADYLRSLVEALVRLGARPEVHVAFDLQALRIPIEKAMPLGLIANELVTNTLKHAFPAGRGGAIRVGFRRDGDHMVMTVADDGVGSPKPSGSEGGGLGSRLMPRLARQLDAVITATSNEGYATTVRFKI